MSTPLYDPYSAFNRTDEVYLGTWFGMDAWAYVTCSRRYGTPEPEWTVLLAQSSEPGDYRCWVGDKSWFEADATIGTSEGPIPMVEHLTETDAGKSLSNGFY